MGGGAWACPSWLLGSVPQFPFLCQGAVVAFPSTQTTELCLACSNGGGGECCSLPISPIQPCFKSVPTAVDLPPQAPWGDLGSPPTPAWTQLLMGFCLTRLQGAVLMLLPGSSPHPPPQEEALEGSHWPRVIRRPGPDSALLLPTHWVESPRVQAAGFISGSTFLAPPFHPPGPAKQLLYEQGQHAGSWHGGTWVTGPAWCLPALLGMAAAALCGPPWSLLYRWGN